MSEKINGFLEAAGAIGEMIYIHYQAFLNAGFNENQALTLAAVVMQSALAANGNEKEDE